MAGGPQAETSIGSRDSVDLGGLRKRDNVPAIVPSLRGLKNRSDGERRFR
jgi:hypothetical protein